MGRPNLSRETKFLGANRDREKKKFPVQLTTSKISNLTRLIHTLVITCRQSMDLLGKVAKPARGQLNRENECFPVPVRA